MAKKAQFTEDDDALLAELGVEVEEQNGSSRSPRDERIIAGYADIERFYEQHGRLPQSGEDKDIFERLYAVRLQQIRASEDCRAVLTGLDKHGILQGQLTEIHSAGDDLDDDALLAELGVLDESENDITKLTHVKTRAEIRAAEEIAKRGICLDFDTFKPLFIAVQEDLKMGIRQSRRFKQDASIEKGEFFILSGQIVYVAEVGEEIKAPNGATDARLRVIYDNGTESDLLMRSLQRALYKDEAGRRITDASAAPLFSDVAEDGDIESGTIYILRSKSDHPLIKEHRDVIHKIGVTSGDIGRRIANAKLDPTFLMADVEVVATYELSNINRVRLEKLIHKFFEPARLNIEIKDRFGNLIVPREWFLVPRFVIDEAIDKIKDNTVLKYQYDAQNQKITVRALI
jgi:Meiotically up-regulated gene 113